MPSMPEPRQKWCAKNNSDEVVTVVSAGQDGVRFTYDSGNPKGESLMHLHGFPKYFRKV